MLRSEAPLDDDEAFDEEIDENGRSLGELVAPAPVPLPGRLAAMEAEEFTPDHVPDTAPIIIEARGGAGQ